MVSAPADPTYFGSFAGWVAKRYGRGGEYWNKLFKSNHSGVAFQEVQYYEVWNEENFQDQWVDKNVLGNCVAGVNPANYAQVYLNARNGIRAQDSQAIVLVGGLGQAHANTNNNNTCSDPLGQPMTCTPASFLQRMYSVNGAMRGGDDGVGIHPYPVKGDTYTDPTAAPIATIQQMRATLRSSPVSDPNVPLFITEVGWATYPNSGNPVWTPSQQATAIDSSADQILRSNCGVQMFLVHSYDYPASNTPWGIRGSASETQYATTANRLETTSESPLTLC
jgi:hypothetical protein